MMASETTAPAKPRVTSSDRVRAWAGPAVLTYPHRPFFLMAGLWAALAMGLWGTMLSGVLRLPTRFNAVDWHAHEMLFGYLGAVMAGYLLGVFPNWTGRLPSLGRPLLSLCLVWCLGRVAIAFSEYSTPGLTALLDLAFPLLLIGVLGREVIAGRGWCNLSQLALLVAFFLANGLFHITAAGGNHAAGALGVRVGLGVAVLMISLVGGRIIPSFTRSWLVRQGRSQRPARQGRLDQFAVIATGAGCFSWALAPETQLCLALGVVAGVANLIRIARWQSWHIRSEPLLWSLHVGYLCVPLGFLAAAAQISSNAAALHIWMAGAIGITSLAMMTRLALGHVETPRRFWWPLTIIYLFMVAAAAFRFIAGLDVVPLWSLFAAAIAWILAFSGGAMMCVSALKLQTR